MMDLPMGFQCIKDLKQILDENIDNVLNTLKEWAQLICSSLSLERKIIF
jgi:hypothetical protein